jgi:hypothetical protein
VARVAGRLRGYSSAPQEQALRNLRKPSSNISWRV